MPHILYKLSNIAAENSFLSLAHTLLAQNNVNIAQLTYSVLPHRKNEHARPCRKNASKNQGRPQSSEKPQAKQATERGGRSTVQGSGHGHAAHPARALYTAAEKSFLSLPHTLLAQNNASVAQLAYSVLPHRRRSVYVHAQKVQLRKI